MKFVKYLFVSLFLAVGMTANAQATYTAADGTEYQFKFFKMAGISVLGSSILSKAKHCLPKSFSDAPMWYNSLL